MWVCRTSASSPCSPRCPAIGADPYWSIPLSSAELEVCDHLAGHRLAQRAAPVAVTKVAAGGFEVPLAGMEVEEDHAVGGELGADHGEVAVGAGREADLRPRGIRRRDLLAQALSGDRL